MLVIDVNSFGALAGDGPFNSGPPPRGGASNRGNRGGVSDEN